MGMKKQNKWYNDEMRKLELIQKGMFDQYNTLDKKVDVNDIKNVINSNLTFTPTSGQTLSSYVAQLAVYVKFNADANIRTHINGVKGAWWTHKNPMGCFACNDTNLIHVMKDLLTLISIKYPDIKL